MTTFAVAPRSFRRVREFTGLLERYAKERIAPPEPAADAEEPLAETTMAEAEASSPAAPADAASEMLALTSGQLLMAVLKDDAFATELASVVLVGGDGEPLSGDAWQSDDLDAGLVAEGWRAFMTASESLTERLLGLPETSA